MSRPRRLPALARAALVAVVASLIVPGAAGALADDPLVPPDGALFGAHVEDERGNVSEAGLLAFERRIGRPLDIDHYYRPWRIEWPDGRERWDFAAGRIPMVSWGKTDLAAVTSGSLDPVIRRRARAIAALGRPFFLRWFWEMDGRHNGEGGPFSVTGRDYVAAWKHIRAIFAAEGAGNAVFVWCPNAWAFDTGRGPDYYPGDDQVDWICADGYDWFPANPGARDLSFRSVFQKWYDWASRRPKPLMIGEYGALEHGTGHKARWITDARNTIKSAFPKIKAVVWFNHRGLAHEAAGIDWRIETSPDATAAFAAFATDPYFDTRSALPAPAVPEAPWPALLPATAAAAAVLGLAARRRRRRPGITDNAGRNHATI